jgi:hypothetical protein
LSFRELGRDTTPQQDSLSGVIICPAYWNGQRLRVNSFTTTNAPVDTRSASMSRWWTGGVPSAPSRRPARCTLPATESRTVHARVFSMTLQFAIPLFALRVGKEEPRLCRDRYWLHAKSSTFALTAAAAGGRSPNARSRPIDEQCRWAQTRRNLGTLNLRERAKRLPFCGRSRRKGESKTRLQTSAVQRQRCEKPTTSASFGAEVAFKSG